MTRGQAGITKEQFVKKSEESPEQVKGSNDFENMAHQLETSEHRYRRLFEAAQDGILILDAATAQIVDVNPFLIKMLGYSKEEFLGKKLWEVGSFRKVEAAKEAFEKLQIEHYVRYEDMPLEAKNGKLISVEFVSNVYNVDHTSVIQCNIRDISVRKDAERSLKMSLEALALSEKRYDTIFQSANEGILITDITTKQFQYANPAICRMLGYSQEELKKMALGDIHPRDSLKHVVSEFEAQSKSGDMRSENILCVRKDGTTFYADINSARVLLDGRKCNVGFFSDVTERKHSEESLKMSLEALAASEQRYSTIFKSANEGILIANIATKQFQYANPAICRMLGYSQEELKNMFVGDIHPKDLLKHAVSEFEALAKGEKTILEGIPCLRKDGTILYADITSAVALLDGVKSNVGFFTDITERMLAQNERRQNIEKQLKAMDDTIKVLAMTVEIRDPYTAGHQERVSNLATCIAQEMRLPAEQIKGIRVAGIVHDIGKRNPKQARSIE